MKPKILTLLMLAGSMVVGGGFLLFHRVTLLRIENLDHPRTIRLPINPPETFSVCYIHSIHKEPVLEEFLAEKDGIVLKGVRTKSPAVMEYYGFEDTKEFHPMNYRLGTVFIIKRGLGEGQGLILKERKIAFNQIGERGDRFQLRVESVSPGSYLLSMVF